MELSMANQVWGSPSTFVSSCVITYRIGIPIHELRSKRPETSIICIF